MKPLELIGTYTGIFAAVGPPVGAISLVTFTALTTPGPSIAEVFSSAWVYAIAILGAYLLGAVPAAIAGAVLGALAEQRRAGRMFHIVAGMTLGAFSCVIASIVLSSWMGSAYQFHWAPPLTGAISGTACGLLCSFHTAEA